MKKKYALVTGGTKGIGRSLVELFAKHKYNIITCARDQKALQKLNQDLETTYGIEVLISTADLSQKKDCKTFISLIRDTVPHINVLINCAGVFIPQPMLEEEDSVFEDTFHANVFAPYYITKELFDLVEKANGHIFNIGSVASKKPFHNCASYVASKFALHGLTLSLREISKDKNVKVTSVLPGATFTASWAGTNVDPERIMNPDSVAEAIFTCVQIKGNAVVEELVIRPQLGDL
ncbi:MAG TPA: SDR family NAD(P)-dependent oxidoreductase [Cytophagales bacterium]|nr:SDR family NAD(P)-dependent oxidoreductase [Cytophagales bacterium]